MLKHKQSNKQQKVQQTKNVALLLLFSHFFALCSPCFTLCSHCLSLCFRILFRYIPRSVQRILLAGNSSAHKCRSGTRKNIQDKFNNNAFAFACSFFFDKTYLMAGHVWLPLLNISLVARRRWWMVSCL